MSGTDIDLDDMLGPEPVDPNAPQPEVLVDEAPKSRPMGEASRALLERSRSYPVNRAAKKNTPQTLQRLLSYAAEMPVGSDAARRVGISYSTLKYWLQKSKEGAPGDGFDIQLGDDDETGQDSNLIRFHIAWDDAMEIGMGKVERITVQRATGYWEPLTYQGKVVYRLDPVLLELGYEGPQAYLTDRFGSPVPESIWKMDPDLAMFLLKTRMAKTYNPKTQVDVNVRGGVLVVGAQIANPVDLNLLEETYRREGLPAVTFEDGDDDPT